MGDHIEKQNNHCYIKGRQPILVFEPKGTASLWFCSQWPRYHNWLPEDKGQGHV